MTPRSWAVVAAFAGLAAGPAAACFTVYDAGNRTVYQALQPPVDMSLPLHETLPQAYPGGHLVFGTDPTCPAVNRSRPGPAPELLILTERRAPPASSSDTRVMGGAPGPARAVGARLVPAIAAR